MKFPGAVGHEAGQDGGEAPGLAPVPAPRPASLAPLGRGRGAIAALLGLARVALKHNGTVPSDHQIEQAREALVDFFSTRGGAPSTRGTQGAASAVGAPHGNSTCAGRDQTARGTPLDVLVGWLCTKAPGGRR